MLLLWGLAIGFLQLANPQTVAFTNSLRMWLNMEPHLLLLVFLPIIGFSAAVGQEPHMLRKSWGQIMLLAWPGVVIQFLLIALCAKYFFPYGWTWPEAFLFGAMLSATDPVAVVAVLQEVGASQKLACVIDGESLMNDGSALVIFLLLQQIVEGEAVTIGGAVAQFCLLAVVGMLLGIAFGAATSWLLDNIFRDPTLTTVVTLVSAYSSYYTADRLVGASGLLAVVCNGFTMSLIGGRQITMRAEHAMHGFWGVLEWGANTILFVWMGIVLAIVLPPSHAETAITNQPIHLEARDAGYVVVLYLWLQVARAVLLMVCWWPFNYTGYPLTWRSALVIMWGGLRGAVGMVMALFIFLDTRIHDASFKSYCIFYMGTMAFFTVLINGGSTKALLKWLGFLSYTPEQLGTLTHVIEDMEHIREQQLAGLAPDEVLGEPEPDAVKVWSTLPTAEVLAQAAANTVRPALNTRGSAYAAAVAAGLDPQLLYDYRCRVLNMVKAHYADVFDQHLLSTLQVRTLQGVTDAALDEAGEGLRDWRLLEPSCRLRGLPKLMQIAKLHRLSSTLVQATTYSQSLNNLQLLVGFIHAHRHAQEVLRQHIRSVEAEAHSEAGLATPPTTPLPAVATSSSPNGHPNLHTATEDLGGMRGGAEALLVLQESEDEVAAALLVAEGITRSHPSLPAWLRSKQAAGEILTEQHTFLQHLGDAGLVQPREMLLLEDLMHEQFKSLLRANTGVAAAFHYTRSRPPLNVLPLFDSLGDAEVEQLMRHCDDAAKKQDSTIGRFSHGLHWKVYYPEQLIAAHDSRIEHVVIITKGSVRMHFPIVDGPHARNEEHTVVASVGDALGVCELMLGLPRMSQLTADSMVQALLVPTATFLKLLGAVQGIRTRAWQATAAQLAAQHHHILGQHRQLAPLNIFFRNCTVERVQPGQVFEVPRTALLLTGSVRSLLPLPAEFHLRREHSAPASSITATANGSAADRINGSSGSLQELGRSGSSELLLSPKRQGSGSDSGSSSPKGSSPRGGSPGASVANLAAILEHPAHDQQQHDVVAHEVAAEAQAEKQQQQQQQQQDDARVLASPAELPPGDFSCLTEAMLLQVPRGFQMPTDLQTTTYQAQVLNKGSISVGLSGSAASGAAADGGIAGGAASAHSAGELRRHSKLISPLAKSMGGMLARVSRLAGISRTASDSMPQMPFLQTALASMREQQQERARQDNMRRSSGGTAAAAAARGYPLRSVAEREAGVRLSNESPAASGAAAAPAAGAAGDIEMGVPETALGAAGGSSQPSLFAAAARNSSNGTTPAAVSAAGAGLSRLGQQQQGVAMPRATDVVTGSRAEGRQAGGGSAGGILLSSNSLTRRSTGSLT
ncbi:hypothetical protein OEZ86_009122 [Tetradesmus obliquus]|nr:hypothetical protein OEZ86_009122 [Tetradesmus obliquus]